ncbi:MAG: MFS transporter [Nanoarchaeota archaeon]
MNRVIKLLMLSDVFVLTGFGLVQPILAIFIKDNIVGGTIFAAGLASTMFLITKSAIQLPFSRYVDLHDDKIKWLIVGTFFISCVPFIYILSDHIYYIYAAEIVRGIGSGLAFPTWLGLWSTNLDKRKESFEWSLYSTLVSVGTAVTAAIGALVAEYVGFTATFILVGVLSLIGCMVLLKLQHEKVKQKDGTIKRYKIKT